jgi:hypothetical protein
VKEETRDPGAPKYHYNREERMASLPDAIRSRQRRGILRGNRSLMITLIDVVFLVLLVVIFSFVGRLAGNTNVIPGYAVNADAIEFGDRVLVSVKVKARETPVEIGVVRIRLRYPEGGERVEINEYLPGEKNVEETYRGALPYDGEQTRIVIDFITGDSRGSLTEKIRRE